MSCLGPFCGNAGINEDGLMNNDLPKLPNHEFLVNGLIYELGQFRLQHNIGWKFVEQWITILCESFLPVITFNESNL